MPGQQPLGISCRHRTADRHEWSKFIVAKKDSSPNNPRPCEDLPLGPARALGDFPNEESVPFELPGGWVRRSIALAGRTFELVLPADPDQVLESQLEAEQSRLADPHHAGPDPYWAALWSSAMPTAQAVLQMPWRGDEHVLELGCGVGLVGLAALARGLDVTFSDYVPQALELALHNALRNGYATARLLLLDWNDPPILPASRRYSALLASDILYHGAAHGPLLNTIDRLLTVDGTCWIGDPGRFLAGEFHQLASDRFEVQLRDCHGNSFSVPGAGQYQMFVLRRRRRV